MHLLCAAEPTIGNAAAVHITYKNIWRNLTLATFFDRYLLTVHTRSVLEIVHATFDYNILTLRLDSPHSTRLHIVCPLLLRST